jgi:glycosyltransferase involved in cell wall biosynthesis
VLGDGPLRADLERSCRDRGLAGRVRFLGRVPNDQVYPAVAAAHFLVSTSCGEPYGRNVAEAMAVGTPCACHRSGGPADLIRHRANGLLADELTPPAFADVIEAAVRTPGEWRRLAEAATETASGWARRVVLDGLEAELTALAEEPAAARRAR